MTGFARHAVRILKARFTSSPGDSTLTVSRQGKPLADSTDLPGDHTFSTARAGLGLASWAGLLLAEVLALTLRFDTRSLAATNGPLARLFELSGTMAQLVMAAIAMAAVIGGPRLWRELRRLSESTRRPHNRGRYMVAHAAAFAGFSWLTATLLEGGPAENIVLLARVIGWGIAGLLTVLSWLAIALPPEAWLLLGRGLAGPLLAGTAIALVACGAGRLTTELWRPLGHATFWLVHGLLRLSFRETVWIPAEAIVGTQEFRVRIAPACSGHEGIGLVSVFLAAYLWLFRGVHRFPQALVLIPLGAGLIWLANALRITALVALGTCVSPAIALGGFHSQAGWLAFNAVGLGLILAARRSSLLTLREPDARATPGSGPSRAVVYLAPLFALIVGTMVTGALSDGSFDALYPLRVVAVAGVFWRFHREYGRVRWSWSWAAVGNGIAVFVLWMVLESFTSASASSAGELLNARVNALPSGWALAWLAFRVVGSVITVPFAEELAFRGYLIRRLISADGEQVPPGRFTWLSFIGSSVLFGALHGRWLAGTLAGMLYAMAWYRRGSLSDAVLAHATTNALIAAAVLIGGAWSLWS